MTTNKFVMRLMKVFIAVIIAGVIMGYVSNSLFNRPAYAQLASHHIEQTKRQEQILQKNNGVIAHGINMVGPTAAQ